jgi:cytochrome c-type biogenesis protein CcmH/NrfG
MKNIATLLFTALLAPAAWSALPPEEAARLRAEAAALEARAATAPADAELRVRLGLAYSRLEQVDDARRAFEQATALDPRNAGAHYMLGLIYEKKGLKTQALAAWKACLEHAADPRMKETARKHIHHLSRP